MVVTPSYKIHRYQVRLLQHVRQSITSQEKLAVHAHTISEDVTEVFKGKGEAFLGNSWCEDSEGDVIYAPEYVEHGTRNPIASSEDFICYNWQVSFLAECEILPGAENQLFEQQEGRVIARDARGKFDAQIPETGIIEHMDRGALFTEYGAPNALHCLAWDGRMKDQLTQSQTSTGVRIQGAYSPGCRKYYTSLPT